MKKIIALYRRGDTGKTETLNYVIEILNTITTGNLIPLVPNHTDRQATFVFNGLTVSVCTAGDNAAEIKQNEAYFNNQKCDIAITASRSRGESVDAINAMANSNGVGIQWVRKLVRPHNVYHLNVSDAHQIISWIY
ncbi:hypothetical protein [Bacteroides neonati]|uniref:hypothetical protein n=1 Tax=Bacteroides neonati TaxID=1347393 RepID=UPI0005A60142|nr:hypothetical protein [Bacteroides neonati]